MSNIEVPVAAAVLAFNPALASNEPEFALYTGSSNANAKKSSADRMRELEEMRGMLTDEEYQRKRAEILSAV